MSVRRQPPLNCGRRTRRLSGGCAAGGAGRARPISAPSHFSAPARIAGRCPKTKGSKSPKPISFFVRPVDEHRWEDRYSVARAQIDKAPRAPARPRTPLEGARRPFARMYTIIILLNGRVLSGDIGIFTNRKPPIWGNYEPLAASREVAKWHLKLPKRLLYWISVLFLPARF